MKLPKLENPAGDFWGGFAAMLVALPSAIAFGVTIYSVLGGGVLLGALADLLMNHPDLLGAVMKLFAGGEGAAGADAPGRTSTPEG